MRINDSIVDILKKLAHSTFSNMLALLSSIATVVMAPKLIGVAEYGYFQLYLFYAAYAGCLHFGCSDGIYLRYGGLEYDELDKKKFYSQFYMVMMLQLLLAALILAITLVYVDNANRVFVVSMVLLSMIFTNTTSVLTFILQATNRIREAASINIISRTLYVAFFLVLIFSNASYKLMIIADLVGKVVAFVYAVLITKDIVFIRLKTQLFDWVEWWANVLVGSRLMLANIAGMLVIGVFRLGAEVAWTIEDFGKLSLALSLSVFFAVFINASSVVLFPIIRKASDKSIKQVYVHARTILMAIMLTFLIGYYPLKLLLIYWLPNYAESIFFFGILLPIGIYECRTTLLVNTYLKALYKEKYILWSNLISLLLSVFATALCIWLNSFYGLVAGILIVTATKAIIAEYKLAEIMTLNLRIEHVWENVLIICFVLINILCSVTAGFLIYFFVLSLYIWLKKQDMVVSIEYIKSHVI